MRKNDRERKTSFSAQLRAELTKHPPGTGFDAKRAFVRTCFLQSGTISDPNRSYHLEFKPEANAEALLQTLRGFGLRPKKTTRQGETAVYIKEASEIALVLNIMHAHKALLAFENIRVEKDLRNNLNRKVNFETANLNKTVAAAQEQIDAIRYIEEHGGLLSEPLEKVARLRVQYETASLEEIGALLTPPIGKSGVNHRLRKICEIANQLKGEVPID